jgi:PAS domain S-box-containing protein
LGYFVIIFINVAIAIFAIYYLNRLSSPIDQILEEKLNNVNASRSMIQSLVQQELVQYEMISGTYNTDLQVQFTLYKNEFLNWHQRAVEGVSETMDVTALDSIMKDFQSYVHTSMILQEQLEQGLPHQKVDVYHYQKIVPLVRKLETSCARIIEINREYIAKAEAEAVNLSKSARIIIIIFSFLAIAFSVMASIYFTNKIVKPIKRAINTIRTISKGQLKQKLIISSNDEIAELSREFNNMTERLDEYEQMNIQQIMTEKRKSEAIVSNMPISILVTDHEAKIILVNEPARNLLNITQDNPEGKHISDIIADKSIVALFSQVESFDEKEFDPLKSVIKISKNKTDIYLLNRQVRITDPADKVTAIVTMLQDITPFKELEHLKSEFIAIISHQFKTPLTSIMMILDILLKEIKGKVNSEQRELLNDAKKDSQRLRDFVFDLLQFSKLESGKIKFDFKESDEVTFSKIVSHAIEPLKPFLTEKNIEFRLNISKPFRNFLADFQHLSIVFMNIFENSIHHLKNNGKISLTTANTDNNMQIEITDNGEGIPEDKLQLIFDKFVQAKYFQKDPHGSIGLGLAIAKEIIEAHNGDIRVKSKREKGTTFIIQIPLLNT